MPVFCLKLWQVVPAIHAPEPESDEELLVDAQRKVDAVDISAKKVTEGQNTDSYMVHGSSERRGRSRTDVLLKKNETSK